MTAKIDKTAIISKNAKIGKDVEIGPFCTIGDRVQIGDGTRLISHIVVDGITKIGKNNTFYPFSAIGMISQHLKCKDYTEGVLEIGDNNIFRESSTAHPGTPIDNNITKIGNNCLFMACSHVAHDCIIEDNVIMANSCLLGGHVKIGEFAILGGNSAVHQWCHIGKHSIIGGEVGVLKDVIPYAMVELTNPSYLAGLNLVGLKRRNFSKEQIQALQKAYNMLFGAEGTLLERLSEVEKIYGKDNELVMDIVNFVKTSRDRGLMQPKYQSHAENENGGE